jgi:hypothetical protein
MAHAEFEEREFETPLYHQLRVGNGSVWSPGQVLEHHVGFDYSALCVDSYFWAIHGIREPLYGFQLEELFQHRFWRRRDLHRLLPNFSLNLFLQAKRPEVRKRLTKALKGTSLNAPHWRISLDPSQQQTLEALSSATSGKALVCYATAAFDRLSQLYSHTIQGTIVANSSFPQASVLSGHDAWNYDSPGAIGVANASPERIEGPSLDAQIDALVREGSNTRDEGYDENLKSLVGSVVRVAEESTPSGGSRSALFFERVREVDSLMESLDMPRYQEPIRSYLKVLAFTSTHNLQWYVLGRARYA